MKKRTCDELGVCQALPDCSQCRAPFPPYPFAPGVIERQPRKRWLTPRRVEQLSIVILMLAFVVTLVATLALVSGHLTPGGLQ